MNSALPVMLGLLAGMVAGSIILRWITALVVVLRDGKSVGTSLRALALAAIAATVANSGFWASLLLGVVTWQSLSRPAYPWLPPFVAGLYLALLLLGALALVVANEPSKQLLGRLLSGLRRKHGFLAFMVCSGLVVAPVTLLLIEQELSLGAALGLAVLATPAFYLLGLYMWQFMPPEDPTQRRRYKPRRQLPK